MNIKSLRWAMGADLYWKAVNGKSRRCETCKGTGRAMCMECGGRDNKECRECGGLGSISEYRTNFETIALRKILEKTYRINCADKATLTMEDIPYLSGLRDAGVKDAQVLIDAITAHGEIEIGNLC